ncbi:MAG: neutral/alkaline non-lysosomal ceramidase N-terminal domain-containing protein [Armatimonadetes bacterium]|nr:neutral/alkaline non-lysosomal ceramidase N-terminal domain-containing protein [Armatimonadota bacterium]
MDNATLRVGFGKVDITPPLAAAYLGFHPRQVPFEGIHDRLYARALAAENGDQAIAIVSADALGFSRSIFGPGRDFIAEVREGITQATGIPADHIMVAATHAHSTPQTTDLHDLLGWFPELADWLERLKWQLVSAVTTAWQSREPVEARVGVGEAPGIAWNRRILTTDGRLVIHRDRPPNEQVVKEPRDDRVPAVLFRGATRRGALFGFCCHPTTVQVQPLVSADFPGVATALVERELDLEACLFLQGACGDVGPIRRTTDFEDVALYGRSLGGEAVRQLALQDARNWPAMAPVIAAGTACFEVPRRELPDRQALEQEVARQRQRLETATDEATRQEALGAFRRAFEPLRLCQLGEGPVPLEVQALRLGDVLLVTAEGELFSEFGLRIVAESPAPVTIVVGYANGYQGYFPTRAAWAEGGYEPSVGPWTRVDQHGGELLTEQAIALARQVWDGG